MSSLEAASKTPHQGRKGGRGARPWLILLKQLGLIGLFGGLASLSCMWAFGSVPQTQGEWRLLRGMMRSVFYPCIFCGIAIVVVAGLLLLRPHARHFLHMRWLRLKLVLLAVVIPVLHFRTRSYVLEFYEAIDASNLDEAARLWNIVGSAYLIAFCVMLPIAAMARFKPRLGQRVHGADQARPERA